jgi:hypothetical protein
LFGFRKRGPQLKKQNKLEFVQKPLFRRRLLRDKRAGEQTEVCSALLDIYSYFSAKSNAFMRERRAPGGRPSCRGFPSRCIPGRRVFTAQGVTQNYNRYQLFVIRYGERLKAAMTAALFGTPVVNNSGFS